MTTRAEVRHEADEALKQEIKWHRVYRDAVADLSADHKTGFIAGLRHARKTVKIATKVIR